MATWDEYNNYVYYGDVYKADADTAEAAVLAAETKITTLEGFEQKLVTQRTALTNQISAAKTALSAEFAAVKTTCEQMVGDVANRMDNVRDPTTGEITAVETVMLSLYNLHRDTALTAAEYDALGLTAATFDAYGINCVTFDLSGKIALI